VERTTGTGSTEVVKADASKGKDVRGTLLIEGQFVPSRS